MGHAWNRGAVGGIAACSLGWLLTGCAAGGENIATATASTPGGPSDSGEDAAGAADGSGPTDASGTIPSDDATPRATACTGAPYVGFAATLTTLDVSGGAQPLAGATIGFSTCPGFELTTDSAGKAATQITEGLALSPIYSAGTTVIAAIGAEIPATADVAVTPTLFARDVAPAIPGFAEDGGNAATIVISLGVGAAAAAPCNDAGGVTFSVAGHPEAVVSYGSATWPADPSVTTTPNGTGYAFLSGFAAGTKAAVVTGAKTGCTVQVASSGQTGNFLLVPGAVTIGVATVTN